MANSNQLINFEPLNKNHFNVILRWFNKPHVQLFYSLRKWTYKDVYQKLMPYIRNEKGVKSFVIYFQEQPIGYIQSYPVKDHPWENQDLAEDLIQEAAGIDVFIGEEDYLRRGLGTQIIEDFLNKYIWTAYRYCIADPDIQNHASLSLFQKCGFNEYKQLRCHNALNQIVTLQLFIRKRK